MNRLTTIIITGLLFLFNTAYIYSQTIEERSVRAFSALEVTQGIQVYLSEGSECKVSIEADEEMQSSVITEVRGETLKLSINDKYKRLQFTDLIVKVHVTLPKLTALLVVGNSLVVSTSDFVVDDLTVTVTTTSDVRFNNAIIAKTLNVNANGGGRFISKGKSTADNAYLVAASHGEISLNMEVANNIECSGATQGKITMSGRATDALLSGRSNSELKMKAFEVQNANIVATTAASIGITVKEFMAATATYGGNISYWGKPKSVSKEATSGGKIK